MKFDANLFRKLMNNTKFLMIMFVLVDALFLFMMISILQNAKKSSAGALTDTAQSQTSAEKIVSDLSETDKIQVNNIAQILVNSKVVSPENIKMNFMDNDGIKTYEGYFCDTQPEVTGCTWDVSTADGIFYVTIYYSGQPVRYVYSYGNDTGGYIAKLTDASNNEFYFNIE